jgi:hypothetical protein
MPFPASAYAAKTHINTLQTFKNKVLMSITKFLSVTPFKILLEQTGV